MAGHYPAMKVSSFFVFGSVIVVWVGGAAAQIPPPAVPPAPPPAAAPASRPAPALPDLPEDTVIAKFDDGTQFTMGDFKKYYGVLPPAQQQMVIRDRAEFLHQWALFRKLAKQAEERKLEQESPYKEAIEYSRMQVLSGARINDELNSATVEPADVVKYYDAN